MPREFANGALHQRFTPTPVRRLAHEGCAEESLPFAVGVGAEGVASTVEAALAEMDAIGLIKHTPPFRELRQVQIAAEVYLEEDGPMVRNGDVPGLGADAREDGGGLPRQVTQVPPVWMAKPIKGCSV